MKRVVLAVAAVLVVVTGGGWLALEWLGRGLCGNTSVVEVVSPSRLKKAVLFERSCGATTGFSAQVSVMSANRELGNDSGNVFVAAGHPAEYQMQWLDDATLRIVGGNGDVFKSESRVMGVEIRYE
jgi:hypothetical protein